MKTKTIIFVTLALCCITIASSMAESAKKKDADNVSTGSGPRSCSATSEDKAQSCSVSCKESENAVCSNTKTEASCFCQ